MAKTLEAIRRTERNPDTTAVPTEYARAPTYKNPPGALALKILHAMINHAGVAIDDDTTWHEMSLRDAIREIAIGHLTTDEADAQLTEITGLQLSYWLYDVRSRETVVSRGVVVQHAEIRLPDEQDRRPVRIRWRFGSIFAQIARTSDFYTLLENKIIWGLRSRYAIALYQHISALSGQRNRSVTYTIDELRAVLGVLPHRLLAYKDLNTRAIKPAIEQINACTAARWRLTVELHKRRRSVRSVTIAWEPREEETQPELAFDAPAAPDSDATDTSASGPPPARAPAFPGAGSIKDTAWGEIAVELVQGYDADTVADDYRTWCRSSGIPLDKRGGKRRFRTFCAGYADNQSKPRKKPGKQADYGYDGPSQDQIDRIEAIKREVDARFAGQAQ